MNGAVMYMNPRIGVQVRITSMTPADIPAMMKIETSSHLEPWSHDAFLDELDRPHSRVLVAKLEEGALRGHGSGPLRVPGCLAGYLCYWLVADEIQILNVSVHVDCRCLGIARHLLTHAFAQEVEKGALLAVLEVRKSNAPARALYESLGFRKVGERPDYYGIVREPAITMVLDHAGICNLTAAFSRDAT